MTKIAEQKRDDSGMGIERPILFSPPMVRALLEGRKTQTRRVVKPVRGFEHHNICKPDMAADPWAVWWHGNETDRLGCLQECPYGKPGDQLWVRETWRMDDWNGRIIDSEGGTKDTGLVIVRYFADGKPLYQKRPSDPVPVTPDGKWRPSIFMFRELSRLTLEVANVRVERVQEISEVDAIAEGITKDEAREYVYAGHSPSEEAFVAAYGDLWNRINGKRDGCAWADNPWVWVVEFRKVDA